MYICIFNWTTKKTMSDLRLRLLYKSYTDIYNTQGARFIAYLTIFSLIVTL